MKNSKKSKLALLINRFLGLVAILGVTTFVACNNDGDDPPTQSFTLTIENTFTGKDYLSSGTTDGIGPGGTFQFSFNAGVGHRLSIATMLAQSNDLFYGFAENGLELYDQNGNAYAGDMTSFIYLWDAGTEVNEEPGLGGDQAPRQSGPNTGTDENGTVELISNVNDGFTYPANSEIIQVNLEHDGGTMFTVTITNNSDQANLMGPLAPGVWAIHSADGSIFTEGQTAPSGLEALAEDGDNSGLSAILSDESGYVSPFAPGVYAVFSGDNPLFSDGVMASDAIEALAEDGNPALFSLDGEGGVSTWGVFNTPASGSSPAPIFPGEKYEISFDASPGDKLSFATMLVQTNDLFVAPISIELYNNGTAISGDITSDLELWDAMTELNEYPGAGINQAPRQSAADTGTDESGTVGIVSDGFSYPMITDMVKVTISNN